MFIDVVERGRKAGEERLPVPLLIHKELVKRFMGENPKEEFTPEIMIDYLRHTNIVANIRDMLNLIPEGKEAEFKEAVLSAVERRKVAPINIPRIREIAERGGFSEELEEIHKLEKWVPHTACNHRVFIAKSNDDLAKNPDLTKYDMVICDFEGYTKFADLTKLPKKMIIKGDIDWSYLDFEKLPDLSESIVYGDFLCYNCENFTSLIGAPEKVGGGFYCSRCENLTSLEGAPKEVGGSFYCNNCSKLTSLEGTPKKVGRDFYCRYCENLTSLDGAPKEVGGTFHCGYCSNLTSLEGAPKEVGGDFDCGYCSNLTSLDGAPKEVGGDFYCHNCSKLTSLEGTPKKVGGDFYCRYCDNLTSLDEAPKDVGGSFDCSYCKNLTSAKGLPTQIARKIYCNDEFRPEIDKELEKRKKQTNQSTLPPNGFGNDGR